MEELRAITRSFRAAFQGIVYVVENERNARLHLVTAIMVLVLGVVVGVSNAELAALFFAIVLVFVAEVINTALEKTLDLVEPSRHEQVRIVKDIAAGAVLVTAIGAALIGIAILLPHLLEVSWHR